MIRRFKWIGQPSSYSIKLALFLKKSRKSAALIGCSPESGTLAWGFSSCGLQCWDFSPISRRRWSIIEGWALLTRFRAANSNRIPVSFTLEPGPSQESYFRLIKFPQLNDFPEKNQSSAKVTSFTVEPLYICESNKQILTVPEKPHQIWRTFWSRFGSAFVNFSMIYSLFVHTLSLTKSTIGHRRCFGQK